MRTLTIVPSSAPAVVDLTTPADRRLIALKRHLIGDAYRLADLILIEPDPVAGVEMLGQLKELVQTAELVQAILDAGNDL